MVPCSFLSGSVCSLLESPAPPAHRGSFSVILGVIHCITDVTMSCDSHPNIPKFIASIVVALVGALLNKSKNVLVKMLLSFVTMTTTYIYIE